MEQVKDVLEPTKEFERVEQAYTKNVNDLFDSLVKESNINKEANKATCDEIYAKQAQAKKTGKKRAGSKVGKGFSIAGAVIGFIVMVVGIVMLATGNTGVAPIILLVVGALVGIGLTLLICLVINKSIKKSTSIIQKLEEEIKQKIDEAWEQLRPLNSLFKWNMPQAMISNTVPLIQLDRVYEPKRFWQLVEQYNLKEKHEPNESTVCVQSGTILGNPFVVEKTIYQWMGNQVYTGSLVITWTTVERDSNGNSRTVTHTQTLVASLTKPKPFYDFNTNLIYGNGAAPDLNFSREPLKKSAGEMSEKKLQKFVKKQGKKLDKMSEKALKKGGTFVKLENNEFETLFNCRDRDHEQQFRLLFTPVAQLNMVELLKSKIYGDDFAFSKAGTINLVHSEHSQNFDYHAAPWQLQKFDFEILEANFKSYFNNYLKSLYFDLAPILSIPLYQQYKSHDYIYKKDSKSNITYHEIESLCNYYGAKYFADPQTVTDTILQCEITGKNGGVDNAIIHAYSFRTVQHTTLVPVMGGDGRMHNVPVIWYEYIPLHNSKPVKAFDPQGYAEAKGDAKADMAKDLGLNEVYGQKGLGLSV